MDVFAQDTTHRGARLLVAHLESLDPQAVLNRGYSITYSAKGAVLRDAAEVTPGERLRTRLAHGEVESEAKRTA